MSIPSVIDLKAIVLDPPIGYRELIADAPRLAQGIAELESQRRNLLEALDVFKQRPADSSVAEQLIVALLAYRQQSADLLYQAYGVDLGGEN